MVECLRPIDIEECECMWNSDGSPIEHLSVVRVSRLREILEDYRQWCEKRTQRVCNDAVSLEKEIGVQRNELKARFGVLLKESEEGVHNKSLDPMMEGKE